MSEPSAFERELAEILVDSLNLDVTAEEIDPEAALFGDGLGLDSIDALEIAVDLSRRFGIQLRSDDPDNARIFSSLRALASHIEANRSQ